MTGIDNKKRKILEVSLEIFAREGFRNTDVQVIADEAKVGKGTVYRHFGSKKKLFLAVARYCLEEVATSIDRKVGGIDQRRELAEQQGIAVLLKMVARACADYYQRRPQAVEIIIQERAEFRGSQSPSHLMFRAENRGWIDELLRSEMEQGHLRKVDPRDATNAYADLLFGSIVNGCLEGPKSKLVHRIESAVDLFLKGLSTPLPRKKVAAARRGNRRH